MKEINLSQGKVTIVDDDDFEELSSHNWYYHYGYAVRHAAREGKKHLSIRMHVVIMGKVSGLEIDHINGNPLDNRRENLRHVTRTQNLQNQSPCRGGSSQYKGVRWHKGANKWISKIGIGGKRYHLGYYKSEQDAAWVYNVWAESFFGEYARLNIIQEG